MQVCKLDYLTILPLCSSLFIILGCARLPYTIVMFSGPRHVCVMIIHYDLPSLEFIIISLCEFTFGHLFYNKAPFLFTSAKGSLLYFQRNPEKGKSEHTHSFTLSHIHIHFCPLTIGPEIVVFPPIFFFFFCRVGIFS